MSPFVVDWLNLLVRWAHLIVGIGWIGTSFYFIALDLSLRKRETMREGVYGTAWEVHGGGFYHVEKFVTAPKELPPDLVWYQWEAYLTWVTGFALLILQYYWKADVFLISPDVLPMLPSQAIVISIGSLAGGLVVLGATLVMGIADTSDQSSVSTSISSPAANGRQRSEVRGVLEKSRAVRFGSSGASREMWTASDDSSVPGWGA